MSIPLNTLLEEVLVLPLVLELPLVLSLVFSLLLTLTLVFSLLASASASLWLSLVGSVARAGANSVPPANSATRTETVNFLFTVQLPYSGTPHRSDRLVVSATDWKAG